MFMGTLGTKSKATQWKQVLWVDRVCYRPCYRISTLLFRRYVLMYEQLWHVMKDCVCVYGCVCGCGWVGVMIILANFQAEFLL